jgi:chromosome segregation ATPase
MDIMSRVQSDGSEQNQGSVTAAVDQNSLQDSVMMDEAAIAAIHAAKMLNASLLLADHERAYVNLKAEYDTLLSSFNQQHATLATSCENISQLQEKIVSLNEELTTQRENAIRETRRSKNWEDKDRDSQERLARMEVEADSLRQEVR